ncbi:MAG: hypothetical protein FWE03_02650 [Firmicutes bacterium]|nr:hypothetical protein [Bacillota bacterium]
MDINLQIKPQFEAVFLINGKFCEISNIIFKNNDVVYITVLPLEAFMLPYTIKLIGGKVRSNTDLASCYSLSSNEYYLSLKPRYNYVYTISKAQQPLNNQQSIIEKFFYFVLKGRLCLARECLSDELSKSISDEDLAAFFDGYDDIIKNEKKDGEYYLIAENKGVLFWFEIVDGLIDNIVEKA